MNSKTTPITKPITYQIDQHGDHVLVKVHGKWLMIDTGAATTVGRTPTFEFSGMTFPCVPNYFGFTVEGLTEFIGHQIDYLVGLEVLQHFPFAIDWERKEITFYPPGHEFKGGTIIPLHRGFGGLLLHFPFMFNGKPVEGAFDTGAPVSYMPRIEGTPDGKADDFYPGFGTWTTKLYTNNVQFGDRRFDMKFGIVPDGCLLKTVTPWLCGSEFMKSGPIGINIARMRLHLFSTNKSQSERSDGSETRHAVHPTGGNKKHDLAIDRLAKPEKGDK